MNNWDVYNATIGTVSASLNSLFCIVAFHTHTRCLLLKAIVIFILSKSKHSLSFSYFCCFMSSYNSLLCVCVCTLSFLWYLYFSPWLFYNYLSFLADRFAFLQDFNSNNDSNCCVYNAFSKVLPLPWILPNCQKAMKTCNEYFLIFYHWG